MIKSFSFNLQKNRIVQKPTPPYNQKKNAPNTWICNRRLQKRLQVKHASKLADDATDKVAHALASYRLARVREPGRALARKRHKVVLKVRHVSVALVAPTRLITSQHLSDAVHGEQLD